MARIGVYVGNTAAYADHYLLRQARSVRAERVIASGAAPSGPWAAASVSFGSPAVDTAAQGYAGLTRRLGLSIGRDPITNRRLIRASADLDVLYTMFLNRAADLVGAGRAASAPPLVVHAAGSDVTTLRTATARYRRAVLAACHRATLVLCGSDFLSSVLAELDPSLDVRVHHIGIPVPAREARPPERFEAVAVSRLHPVKGVDRSIRAFDLALRDVDDARLTIVGDGPEEPALRGLVASLRLEDKVTFTGRRTPEEALEVMAESSVMIQHNVRLPDGSEEALGGSLLEASSLGLPVVATRSGGVAEAVVDGVSGLLCAPDDIGGMAAALRELYERPDLRDQLGRAGREHVRSNHDAATQDDVLRRVLLEVQR